MLVLMVFLLPLFCSKMSVCSLPETLPITSLVAYVHVSVWLLFLLLHLYIRRQHDVSRRYGYGMFYRRTVHLRRLTFYITSVGLSFFSHCLWTLDQLVLWALLNLGLKLNCLPRPTAPRACQCQHSTSDSQFMWHYCWCYIKLFLD